MATPDDISILTEEVKQLDGRTSNFTFIGALTTFVLAIISIFLAIIGIYVYMLNGRLGATRDRLAEKEKQVTNEKISAANAAIALSEEKIVEANSEILKSKAKIAEADAKAASANATAQEAISEQQKIAKALAEAKTKQVQAELALRKSLDEVKKKQEPRRLTKEQKSVIISVLKTGMKGPMRFGWNASDDETYSYGQQMLYTFIEAGWGIPDNEFYMLDSKGGDTAGVFIRVKDIKNPPPHAAKLIEAFFKAKIGFEVQQSPNVERFIDNDERPGVFELIIGLKPKL